MKTWERVSLLTIGLLFGIFTVFMTLIIISLNKEPAPSVSAPEIAKAEVVSAITVEPVETEFYDRIAQKDVITVSASPSQSTAIKMLINSKDYALFQIDNTNLNTINTNTKLHELFNFIGIQNE
ncbi:MAG: hypothetical protein WCR55_09695 [Lentisphaerota bacterium]